MEKKKKKAPLLLFWCFHATPEDCCGLWSLVGEAVCGGCPPSTPPAFPPCSLFWGAVWKGCALGVIGGHILGAVVLLLLGGGTGFHAVGSAVARSVQGDGGR